MIQLFENISLRWKYRKEISKHPFGFEIVNGCLFFYDDNRFYHCDFGPAIVYYNSDNKEYWVHGKRHNSNGPAVIANSSKHPKRTYSAYYVNGYMDREDGPAVIAGTDWYVEEKHYKMDKLHCETGPAVHYHSFDPRIDSSRRTYEDQYYLNDKRIRKKVFLKLLKFDQIKNYCLLE